MRVVGGVRPGLAFHPPPPLQGPSTDWAFQSPHYLMGWASGWHEGRFSTLLEIYYNSLYAGAWNLTCSEVACDHILSRRAVSSLRGSDSDDAAVWKAAEREAELARQRRMAMTEPPSWYRAPPAL